MKKIKCEICGKPIMGKEAYIKTKVVCQRCFFRNKPAIEHVSIKTFIKRLKWEE